MTTYTYRGIGLVQDESGIVSVTTSTFRLVASDDCRIGVTPLALGSLTEVALPPAVGTLYTATIDGTAVTSDWVALMTRTDLPGGDAQDTNLLGFQVGPAATGIWNYFLFEISGPGLPALTTPVALNDYLNASSLNGQWTQAQLASLPLDPALFTSRVSVTQNDVINLTGQVWTGGTIRSGIGNDVVTGTAGDDVIDLGGGRDIGRGGLGADRISGAAGNDLLAGFGGADSLSSGAGNDTLDGGSGADRLAGGLDADVFVFRAGYGRDTVLAFEDGIDKIDLSSFNLTQAQVLAAATETAGNVEIALGGGSVLVILNTTEAILRGDFLL